MPIQPQKAWAPWSIPPSPKTQLQCHLPEALPFLMPIMAWTLPIKTNLTQSQLLLIYSWSSLLDHKLLEGKATAEILLSCLVFSTKALTQGGVGKVGGEEPVDSEGLILLPTACLRPRHLPKVVHFHAPGIGNQMYCLPERSAFSPRFPISFPRS